ncbi:MAG TPA: alpha/beta hydrolase [Bacteroidales bacterium]|nr:alpha/beta hydrolase [Bacteroidales bacterium]
MSQVYPVIIVPGITASSLRDQYQLPPDLVWSVMTKKYENIALHPDNYRYEAREPARVREDQVFEIAYEEMISELRHNLSESEDRPVPVYPFAYDWRQPLGLIVSRFEAFVEEVIERTKLMKHYHQPWFLDQPRVNLVGHSMGGLIIAGYLTQNGNRKNVAKVATLGTPYRGSFEAIIKIATGTANLGTTPPSSREREAARITPSLYHLLPSCDGIRVPAGVSTDIFDPSIWQPSVLDTLREYIRLNGVFDRDPALQAQELFGALLRDAALQRKETDALDLAAAGLSPSDWLCVAGVDSVTRVGVEVSRDSKGFFFNFNGADRANNWNQKVTNEEKLLTGDGTVPLKAAIPPFLKPEHVVCLSPDDFGYWELKDRAAVNLAGFHGLMANMNVIHRLIVRHFTGAPDAYKNTWGRALPGVDPAKWAPPFDLYLKTT